MWEDTLKNGVHQLRPCAMGGSPESLPPLGACTSPRLLSRRPRFLPEDSQPHESVLARSCSHSPHLQLSPGTCSHAFQAAKFRPASPTHLQIPKARLRPSSTELGLEDNGDYNTAKEGGNMKQDSRLVKAKGHPCWPLSAPIPNSRLQGSAPNP